MTVETIHTIPCAGGPADGKILSYRDPVPARVRFPMQNAEDFQVRYIGPNDPIGAWDEGGQRLVPDGQGGWRYPILKEAVYRLEETPEGMVYRFEEIR